MRSFLITGGLLAAFAVVGPVAAAEADSAADGGDNAATLAEVVVTANKREENTKDVPVSVGVLDGRSIEALHVEDLEDVSRIVPGVSFAAHNNGPNGPGQDNITIRGISSTVGNPTVGIYMDEVPIITITGYEGDAEPRLIDIDRIEVLRGPQGNLVWRELRGRRRSASLPTNRILTNSAAGSVRKGHIPSTEAITTTPRA